MYNHDCVETTNCCNCQHVVLEKDIIYFRDYGEGFGGPIYQLCRSCYRAEAQHNEMLSIVPRSQVP